MVPFRAPKICQCRYLRLFSLETFSTLKITDSAITSQSLLVTEYVRQIYCIFQMPLISGDTFEPHMARSRRQNMALLILFQTRAVSLSWHSLIPSAKVSLGTRMKIIAVSKLKVQNNYQNGRCAYVAVCLLSHFDLRFSFFMPFQELEKRNSGTPVQKLIYQQQLIPSLSRILVQLSKQFVSGILRGIVLIYQ